MSSVILDEELEQETRTASLAGRVSEATTSDVIASPEELPFDRVSRQRLLVAQSAADTIERLVETGAWERLEPAVAEHLIILARRLEGYVVTLAQARPVRSSEPALLLLRRLERRLGIVVDVVEGEAEKSSRMVGGGLFLGDFTEIALDRSPTAGRSKTETGKKKGAKAEAKAAGSRQWASKAEKVAAVRQSRRVMMYIGVAAVAVVGSVAWRAVTTLQEHPVRQTPPPVSFTPNEYLKDVQGFVPATATAYQGNDLSVVVTKEWLLRTIDRRVTDANGLATFLMNRNVRRLRLQWEDGRGIVQFENGTPTWFNERTGDGGQRPSTAGQ